MGNWKMHGTFSANAALLDGLVAGQSRAGDTELAVCAPFPYLFQLRDRLANTSVRWGGQDVSMHAAGAYTGEVSAAMLVDLGCAWVLCGHSERRQLHGETSATVAVKVASALQAGLTPVVCVGETLQDREAGQTQAECVLADQLDPVLALGAQALSQVVIAYEPVWAIGTGHTATPEQAQAAHAYLRATLAQQGAADVRILYGGSVRAKNAAALFAQPDIDGALVGGASLDADEFLNIAAA